MTFTEKMKRTWNKFYRYSEPILFILILTLVFMLVVLQLGKIASNDNYRSENNHLKTELKETKQENKKL